MLREGIDKGMILGHLLEELEGELREQYLQHQEDFHDLLAGEKYMYLYSLLSRLVWPNYKKKEK